MLVVFIATGLVGLWLPGTTQGQAQHNGGALPLGQIIEREMKVGESHRYTLEYAPGQYLRILVRQQGVKLTAVILTHSGERVASGDRANQMHGPKSIHLVTSANSPYSLEIQATELAQAGGRYTVQLVAAQPAGERERQLFAAQTLFSAAFGLASQPKPDARRQGREKYLEALDAFRAANDWEGEALALTELGLVNYGLGETRQAIEWTQQALKVWRAGNDQYGEARVLNNLGAFHSNLGELQETIAYFRQALPLWRALGDMNGEARTLNNMSAAHFYLGEWQDMLTCSKQALGLWEQAGDRASQPFALNTLGICYFELGDPVQALAHQQEALARAKSVIEKTDRSIKIEARILTNLGELFIAQQDQTQALRYLNESLTLRRQVEDKEGQAMTLADIGFVHNRAGRKAEALANYDAALVLARANGYRFVEATILKKFGELFSQSEPMRARQSFRDSFGIFHAIEEKDAEAEVLHGLALLERAQGDAKSARAHLETALALTEGLRTKVGSLDLRALFFARKQDYFTSYIDLLMQEHGTDPAAGFDRQALQVSERARARSLLELLAEARADVRQGAPPELIARLQELRSLIVGKTNRLLRQRGDKATAEQIAASEAEIRRITAEYEQVQAHLRAHPRYAALNQPQPLQVAEMQALLDPQTLLLQYALGPERSYLWVVSQTGLESYVLPARAEIEAAAQEVFELMVAHQPIPGETFAARAARFRSVDERYWPAAARLSKLALGPLTGKLAEKRLLVVPDGTLHNISFSALPDPSVKLAGNSPTAAPLPLVANHEIIYLPSASVLAVQRRDRQDKPSALRAMAVFADPVFSADDPRVISRNQTKATKAPPKQPSTEKPAKVDLTAQLTRSVPGASWLREEMVLPRLQNSLGELREIQKLVPRDSLLTAWDFAANREAVLDPKLKQYRMIHFATHALLNDEHPALSGIVLSLVNPDGSPRAGFLQLHDIYNLDLDADLVVLSACQTARGQSVRGEGIIGLTRGFLYSGAQRVVSSLWSVEDTATAELMKQFYHELLEQKRSPAAALRQAQLALWRQRAWQSPYYWSGFALHGEWR